MKSGLQKSVFRLVNIKVQNLRLPSDSSELVFMIMEKELLNEYEIDDSTFYKSYSWYLDEPDIMYDIYTSIVDTLTLRQSLLRREE